MEHKLILGGEQYLPFARSCVTKLKKLGLSHASQAYEVDGVSIKVRIEPGHEYIRLEGGAPLGWKVLPFGERAHPEPPKTENPWVFVTTSARLREESTLRSGTYLWSGDGGERVLFGSRGSFVYRQCECTAHSGDDAPRIQASSGGMAGNYIILAEYTGTSTEFFAVPKSAAPAGIKTAEVFSAVSIGISPATEGWLDWRVSPDGTKAIALEGTGDQLTWPGYAPDGSGTEFLEYSDDKRNSWIGVQHIHRADIVPSDTEDGPPFSMIFTKETRKNAVLKCVPVSTFVVVDMRRDYQEYPYYASHMSYRVTYDISKSPFDHFFSASQFDGVGFWGGAMPLTNLYPASLDAVPGLTNGVHQDIANLMVGTVVSAKPYALLYEGTPNLFGGGWLIRTWELTDIHGTTYASRYYSHAVRDVVVPQATAPAAGGSQRGVLDDPVFLFAATHFPTGTVAYLGDLAGFMIRTPGEIRFPPNGTPKWMPLPRMSIYYDTLTVLDINAGKSTMSSTYDPFDGTPWMEGILTITSIRFTFPFDHKVTTHWERKTTFHYEGRRVIAVDYDIDGEESFLEVLGREDDKVTYAVVEKTLRSGEPSNNGKLGYEYSVSGECGYSLLLNNKLLSRHKVTASAERTESVEDYTSPDGVVLRDVDRWHNPQNAREEAFHLYGADLRNGVVLFHESVREYAEGGAAVSAWTGKSDGKITANGSLRIHVSGADTFTLSDDEQSIVTTTSFINSAGLQQLGTLTAIVTGSRRGHLTSEYCGLSGVAFARADFTVPDGMPNEQGRVKFQGLLPAENRDMSGDLGEYTGKYSKGWYRYQDGVTVDSERAWLFREVAVLMPEAVAAFYWVDNPKSFSYRLYALSRKKWMVFGRVVQDASELYDLPYFWKVVTLKEDTDDEGTKEYSITAKELDFMFVSRGAYDNPEITFVA